MSDGSEIVSKSHQKLSSLNVDDWSYCDFEQHALEDDLSMYEKIGFPNEYRKGKERVIFNDILSKIDNLKLEERIVFDIGAGCTDLPQFLIDHCVERDNELYLFDNENMLSHLNIGKNVKKVFGEFPNSFEDDLPAFQNSVDVIICYSVIQYIYSDGNIWKFIDTCLECLATGGEFLIGDIPNLSMRKRFFNGETGKQNHRMFTGKDEDPPLRYNFIEKGKMDDSVIIAIISRARAQGFQAWVVPQNASLPMANRREDIVIKKP